MKPPVVISFLPRRALIQRNATVVAIVAALHSLFSQQPYINNMHAAEDLDTSLIGFSTSVLGHLAFCTGQTLREFQIIARNTVELLTNFPLAVAPIPVVFTRVPAAPHLFFFDRGIAATKGLDGLNL